MQSPWQAPTPADYPLASQTVRLARGQTMQVWLPAGSLVVNNAPAARVTQAPQWLFDQLVEQRSDLSDGQAMAIEHAGWVEITAPQGGEVLCLRPQAQSWRQRLQSACRRLLNWGQRTAPAGQ
ncbi:MULTISPECIES: hypothetical protein [unclassified Herbaspirillum]|uniref:hypothetical protein n=1 Tax=unclassified Herbaspirillum TaxID=2624150 RepID=UPI00114FA405|nr:MULTISPECIES: hypothetical protein [unclassified Herbaspirillum]MBB5392180.1 hypothetical protein [Herbaspirillum sp. SJZ102]TQK13637.1 hypothetical protein FB599_1056 [Herbaspirillum sp. SJZ130]TQK15640.1 hypothetical protein FB598_0993 [Herbaspirillum sp. SJZ106]TWC71539.1 hypothetical protein FB597_101513 [Herbaspirillum sp. SJZ099]